MPEVRQRYNNGFILLGIVQKGQKNRGTLDSGKRSFLSVQGGAKKV